MITKMSVMLACNSHMVLHSDLIHFEQKQLVFEEFRVSSHFLFMWKLNASASGFDPYSLFSNT